jgi:hypothetical protein
VLQGDVVRFLTVDVQEQCFFLLCCYPAGGGVWFFVPQVKM